MQLEFLPLAALADHEHNRTLREDGIADLAASFDKVGILQPLTVIPVDNNEQATDSTDSPAPSGEATYTIVDGHHRRAAAARLEWDTVPCLVADSLDAARQIVAMLAGNLTHTDITPTEEANAYHQLALLEWEPERIAAETGRSAQHVEHSLALHSLPQRAQAAVDDGHIDLVAAASLADVADDAELVDKVLTQAEKSNFWNIQHVVHDEYVKKEKKQQAKELSAELTLAGVDVTSRPKEIGWFDSTPQPISRLVDADGTNLADRISEGHLDPADLPGVKAYVDKDGPVPAPVYYVADPDRHGYTRSDRFLTAEQQRAHDEAEYERHQEHARRQRHRERLNTAASVRRDFLCQTFGSLKLCKRHYRRALNHVLRTMHWDNLSAESRQLRDRIAGFDIDDTQDLLGNDRLTRVAVATWLAHNEQVFVNATIGWTGDSHKALDYLEVLVEAGYGLSDVEAQVVTDIQPDHHLAASATDDSTHHEVDQTDPVEGDNATDGDLQPA
ncbi:ParB/RepB/Spo0J family partition protein [Haloglycomyces albus]|uniref:ParB/RepB/Spo0J family partition protein n=1 Tax=Haloglycomyces albus TaxID=526067 RepID=UPI00046CA421|nr:ParB/RepB/Spo0J family partition protein [Haloglycomyces albus]